MMRELLGEMSRANAAFNLKGRSVGQVQHEVISRYEVLRLHGVRDLRPGVPRDSF